MYWAADAKWYAGTVADVQTQRHSKQVLIRYTDNEEEWGDLLQGGNSFLRVDEEGENEICSLEWQDAAVAAVLPEAALRTERVQVCLSTAVPLLTLKPPFTQSACITFLRTAPCKHLCCATHLTASS